MGEVRNTTRLHSAMAKVDIVIHAAAMTHVDVVEVTLAEASTTTVLGTQHVIEAAIDAGVERMLRTSADTVVDPTNMMATTTMAVKPLTLDYVEACRWFRRDSSNCSH